MSCVYCGSVFKLGTDHIVPRSRGGLDIPENRIRACLRCNSSKNKKLPSEWRSDLPPGVYDLERKALALHSELRPMKNNRAPKNKVINVKLTKDQKSALEQIAASEGMGVSTWLLQTGLRAMYAKEEAR